MTLSGSVSVDVANVSQNRLDFCIDIFIRTILDYCIDIFIRTILDYCIDIFIRTILDYCIDILRSLHSRQALRKCIQTTTPSFNFG